MPSQRHPGRVRSALIFERRGSADLARCALCADGSSFAALRSLQREYRWCFIGPLEGVPLRKRIVEVAMPPPPPRTKWTRRVPHPVLIGHAASLSQVVAEPFFLGAAAGAFAGGGGTQAPPA